MNSASAITFAYIVASILFIFGLKMLGRPETARRGNLISALGMLIAVVATLLDRQIISFQWIAIGLIAGSVIGIVGAKAVKMTSMPEMVALFNGFGGLASLLVGWSEFQKAANAGTALPSFTAIVVALAVIIGGVTFTGSLFAFLKLAAWISGRAIVFPGQRMINLVVAGGASAAMVGFALQSDPAQAYPLFFVFLGLSIVLGFSGVVPIGGGDMPVVISLLNSCSGLAAAAAGFAINNNGIIVAGCLVGTSGLILTMIMCKAKNRNLINVLFYGFGATDQAAGGTTVEGELKPISPADTFFVLEAAQSIVFVPGYGMAVAQAQHVVKELAALLEENGAEVHFAIHPVAGRMPGHMNVLLAEADVAYEQLVEMDAINPRMPSVDVAMVIGANDVVNPAAARDQSSPIYGMPIIEAHEAKTVICLKRGKGTGFSGLENHLFLMPNTRMLYGDAKGSISALVGEFKNR
jgi:NAD(P) transhydrogenase subunit beta